MTRTLGTLGKIGNLGCLFYGRVLFFIRIAVLESLGVRQKIDRVRY